MKKLIDYKTDYGEYLDDDGCTWQDAESFLHGKFLGFCCCGSPKENLIYVYKGLLIVEDSIDDSISWSEGCRIQAKKLIEYFVSDNAKMFFFYWADKEGYTEHGSGLSWGGWLTDKGKELIQIIKEFLESEGEVLK